MNIAQITRATHRRSGGMHAISQTRISSVTTQVTLVYLEIMHDGKLVCEVMSEIGPFWCEKSTPIDKNKVDAYK